MSLHPTFPLRLEQGSAQLILTPCPGTKDISLTSSLKQLKDSGVSAVVTLMTSAELSALSLSDISTITRSLGMQWFHLAIEDDCAPDASFSESWKTAGPAIHELLNRDEHIAVHCKGGSGRTGLVSGQILIERGEELSQVIEKIQKLRPNAFKLEKHIDYIKSVEKNVINS
ncbi:phosphatase domain-containing putative toxin [Psychromonas algicola]|uniref:phosphatase domain-containing putative toxin n=1 Tax=Psychromonas algicola TaxID=2555642 RepID=UPI001068BD9B|nr:dual specificity protein phosphatase family protein [Psychromonas sp. RZ5]TEW52619.1 protein phosphatase [Psychromonas sp. RZ5]